MALVSLGLQAKGRSRGEGFSPGLAVLSRSSLERVEKIKPLSDVPTRGRCLAIRKDVGSAWVQDLNEVRILAGAPISSHGGWCPWTWPCGHSIKIFIYVFNFKKMFYLFGLFFQGESMSGRGAGVGEQRI